MKAATTHGGNMRLQWDPDHGPMGGKCARRAIQLGLKKEWSEGLASGEEVLQIIDMTSFVITQRENISMDMRKMLMVPVERPYVIE